MKGSIAENPEVKSGIDLFCAWVDSQMSYAGLPGVAAGVVYDQELVWARGFGCADLERSIPVTSKTLFRIASITKLFTSTAIMILRDAGKLKLDDPVNKFLPWFQIQNSFPEAPVITIQHLLTHTSGIPREADFPYWTTADFPTIEEIRNTIGNQKTILPTETKWKYSNLALSLAGEIVAAVSQRSYTDFVEENILQPLQMDGTYVRTLPQDHPLLATGYGRRMPDLKRAIRPFGDCKGISAAANMASSVEDLAKFAMLQFRDGTAGGKEFTLIVRQISGAIAKRIVCPIEPGAAFAKGEIYGMIKFGSRTELFFPACPDIELKVKVGDRVYAGTAVVAEIKNNTELK